jgi:hypothetical protein
VSFANKIRAQHVDMVFHPTNIGVEKIGYHTETFIRILATTEEQELKHPTQWKLGSSFVGEIRVSSLEVTHSSFIQGSHKEVRGLRRVQVTIYTTGRSASGN